MVVVVVVAEMVVVVVVACDNRGMVKVNKIDIEKERIVMSLQVKGEVVEEGTGVKIFAAVETGSPLFASELPL